MNGSIPGVGENGPDATGESGSKSFDLGTFTDANVKNLVVSFTGAVDQELMNAHFGIQASTGINQAWQQPKFFCTAGFGHNLP